MLHEKRGRDVVAGVLGPIAVSLDHVSRHIDKRVGTPFIFEPGPETALVQRLRVGPVASVGTAYGDIAVFSPGIIPGSVVDLAEAAMKALIRFDVQAPARRAGFERHCSSYLY